MQNSKVIRNFLMCTFTSIKGMQDIAKDKEKGLTPTKDEKAEPLK